MGERNKIHVSEETANFLTEARKGQWLCPRKEIVVAKGKGELATFWLYMKAGSNKSVSSSNFSDEGTEGDGNLAALSRSPPQRIINQEEEKKARLINWTSEVLMMGLKAIVARREAVNSCREPDSVLDMIEENLVRYKSTNMVLEEVKDVISLPRYDSAAKRAKPDSITIDKKVVGQLHDYLRTISALYPSNSFHNFEHVCHVSMSVSKLLSRIVAPEPRMANYETTDHSSAFNEKTLHDHTYGITSDPLTQTSLPDRGPRATNGKLRND